MCCLWGRMFDTPALNSTQQALLHSITDGVNVLSSNRTCKVICAYGLLNIMSKESLVEQENGFQI